MTVADKIYKTLLYFVIIITLLIVGFTFYKTVLNSDFVMIKGEEAQ